MERDVNKLQYPCPNSMLAEHVHSKDPRLTTIQECALCNKHLSCDIYATMLDEVNDMK